MTAGRVCNTAGCPHPAEYRGRCKTHAAQAERARGTRQQRGYDQDHQTERTRWQRLITALGHIPCRRCQQPIHAGDPFDLGHPDAECPRPRAPEHPQCNRAAAGRSAHNQPTRGGEYP